MNAQLHTNYPATSDSSLKVVKSDLKVFNVRYMQTLNLIMAVGWSITDDAWIKYCDMLADIEVHLMRRDELTIYFKLELFNSSSAAYIFKVIKRLNQAHQEGKKVKIYWSCASSDYKDEMIDSGLDFAGLAEFKFQITEA